MKEILKQHKLWVESNHTKGVRADLYGANLRGADLYGANLRGANLYGVNLRGANLYGANLYEANLSRTDLRCANLSRTDLRWANLSRTDLRGANLSGADIDFSCIPLWCGGLGFKIDEKQARQFKYHIKQIFQTSGFDYDEIDENKFHRVESGECKKLK